MTKKKTSISLSEDLSKWVQQQIKKRKFASLTHAIEYALQQLRTQEKTLAKT